MFFFKGAADHSAREELPQLALTNEHLDSKMQKSKRSRNRTRASHHVEN